MEGDGWSGLFASAFTQSRNPMVLADAERRIVDVNAAFVQLVGRSRGDLVGRRGYTLIAGGPLATPSEWRDALAKRRFTGEATLLHADGSGIAVQWAAVCETATGRRLVLFVALNTSRWGGRFRRGVDDGSAGGALSGREREVVHHVAAGRSGPEIADELGITHDTVRTHVRNAMTKVGARSRAHLVAKALGEMHVGEAVVLGPDAVVADVHADR
jgi:PAS domain S-box-containing protein